MEQKIITIFGGTGFVGKSVVQRLANAGYRLRIITRHPERYLSLKTLGDVGQIALIAGNIKDEKSIASAVIGSYAVINLVGVLFEKGKQNFTALHAQGAEKLAIASKNAGVARFVQISALGVECELGSAYARTKLLGERAVLLAFPEATILRPSVIFGADDNFFNQFAQTLLITPIFPLIGGGKTLFQPVFVGDVALAVAKCLEQPKTKGQIYELGGNKTYSFKEIIEYILQVLGIKRRFISISFFTSSILAAIAEFFPNPRLTRDQVKLLKFPNTITSGAKTFTDLEIKPKTIEEIVPFYLARFHKNMKV